MKSAILTVLGLLATVGPAAAETARHHRGHRHGHIVGTHARRGEPGFPITAAKDSIRINAVGEVISQPVPVIQKERSFNDRARRDLSRTRPAMPEASPQAPLATVPQR